MVVIGDCSGPLEYHITVPLLFDKLSIKWDVWNGKQIAIKVNLVSANPYPFDTHPALVKAVGAEICKRCKDVDIFVIEGSPQNATQMYLKHGYLDLPYNLIDIDTRTAYYTSKIVDDIFPEVTLPLAIKDAILISCAVAKEHTECHYTGCVKNLVGLPPTQLYTHNGLWKNVLHDKDIHGVIKALNKHKPIDLAVLDATIGTKRDHIDGEFYNPPIGKLVIGDCAFETDKVGCKLMGIDPNSIVHLN